MAFHTMAVLMVGCQDDHFRISTLASNVRSPENQAFKTGDTEFWRRTMYGLDFGDIQRMETRRGTAYVREAAPTEQFWKAWRQNKDAVKAVGFSIRKYHDEWAVSFWSDSEDCRLPESPT